LRIAYCVSRIAYFIRTTHHARCITNKNSAVSAGSAVNGISERKNCQLQWDTPRGVPLPNSDFRPQWDMAHDVAYATVAPRGVPFPNHTPAFAGYVFSMPLTFATIPKACGPSTSLRTVFEAATLYTSILLGGSLIPIVVYWDGDGFSWLNTYFAGVPSSLRRQGSKTENPKCVIGHCRMLEIF
jgi:hypothetical protein